jgi:hypothetical protein
MMLRRMIPLAGVAMVAVTYGASLGQSPPSPPPASMLVPTPRPSIAVPVPSYDRKGRRDPFVPIELVRQPEIKPPVVASARLKGIVRGMPPRALLETPDGIGYILKAGDILADGRLIEIGPDKVVFSVPPRRGTAPERIVLRLPTE